MENLVMPGSMRPPAGLAYHVMCAVGMPFGTLSGAASSLFTSAGDRLRA